MEANTPKTAKYYVVDIAKIRYNIILGFSPVK
jgi:hypothetical protein